MRISLFTSDLDILAQDKEALLTRLGISVDPGIVTEVHALTYRLPKPAFDPPNLHHLPCQETFRITFCRRLFRMIDNSPWLPPVLALLPLSLCSRQIRETLIATDPDAVLFFGIRWRDHLRRFLSKRYPHWTFITRPRQPFPNNGPSRTFDPSSSVSIILPTFNGSRYLCQSIDSCLRQTYKNIELIVVDDGSTEDIPSLLSRYADPRLRYIRHEKNLGLPHALNTGFRHSTGEYLTWTSDDNYFADTAIEEMVRFLQSYPEVDFVYAQSYVLNEDGERAPITIAPIVSPENLAIRNVVGACFLYKRNVYETIGDYNPRFFLAEDYDYWIRVAHKFRLQPLFKPLYYYRFHDRSLTSQHHLRVREVSDLVKQAHNIS